jgi:hypothetical protein
VWSLLKIRGDSNSPDETHSYINELQGTWVYSSDHHYSGGACGLDASGNYGRRLTITFTGDQYTSKDESCLILLGNTGGYFESNSGNGRIEIGRVFLEVPSDPSQNLRAIDFISDTTLYSSYRINQSALYIADSHREFDGSTAELRAFDTRISFIKQ